MAPVVEFRLEIAGWGGCGAATAEAARMNRAAWRHRHFAAKSAPQHRDFAAGKVETN